MRNRRSSRSGQALILVTVSLLAMSGMIGMVVDFGVSYFMRRAAQSAADAAALAAANAALDAISGGQVSYSALASQATSDCTGTIPDNRQSACDYAQQNGFSAANIKVTGDTTANHPAGVNARYWVTVQVSNSIPQLYSAVLGNPTANIASKATAAIVDAVVDASMVATGRENDSQPHWQAGNSPGTNNPVLLAGTGSQLNFATGIQLASSDAGSGDNLSSGQPRASRTLTRGGLQGVWNSASSFAHQGDGGPFYDPFHGMGQPPLSGSALSNKYAVPGGDLNAFCSSNCRPGVYYAVQADGVTPSGVPLSVGANLNFADQGGKFGDYVFYGGLNIASGNVDFGPGRYVMAGVSNPNTNYDLNIGSGATVTGGSGAHDSGRLFILTDAGYPGLSQVANVPNLPALYFGQTSINGNVSLYGLDSSLTPALPSDANSQRSTLSDFGSLILWQDQRLSNIQYTASGNLCGSLASPCANARTPNTDPILILGRASSLDGVVYQPRGAWMRFPPSAVVSGPMILISGAFDIGPNTILNPLSPSRPNPPTPRALKLRRVALVE